MTLKSLPTIIAVAALAACSSGEKAIYHPQELVNNDFNNPQSDWSYSRMLKTPNMAIFWEKGFGQDLANPPALDGQPMDIDLPNLAEKLEDFYAFFTDSLQFVLPGSKAEKNRMLVMLRYSNEGTAYGGDYDQEIGALWVTPNRLRDSTLNCIAHELGHSFQAQITCDGQGEAWGGCGFFEMTSQWMLWQVNPNWVHDEAFHFDAFRQLTHRAYLHLDNIYHSPYVLEAWGEKHGKPFIAQLYREGKIGEDPVITYKRVTGEDQEAFCDEMYETSARIVNLDFPRTWDYTRDFAATFATPMVQERDGWMRPDSAHAPEAYGFNVIPVDVPAPGSTAKAQLQELASLKGYHIENAEEAGWRYGLVGIDQDGRSVYGPMAKAPGEIAQFETPDDAPLRGLYLVVMGAPTQHHILPEGEAQAPQYPYQVKVISNE
ncbi:MAG: DUF6055 domain-containing protein [Bacteroidales bacterium]|nr:DUF6055 domain-containing protein [Bacteroidales bacterium]